jgi:hypothetical protein
MSGHWEDLDVEALLNRREEATTSANVGAFQVPLGRPLRRAFPTVSKGYTQVEHPYLPRHEGAGADLDLAWAKDQIE